MGLGARVMLVLEGGYNLGVLAWAGEVIVRQLTGTVPKETVEKMQRTRSTG